MNTTMLSEMKYVRQKLLIVVYNKSRYNNWLIAKQILMWGEKRERIA